MQNGNRQIPNTSYDITNRIFLQPMKKLIRLWKKKKTALTDSEVTPEVKTYEGFVSPSAKKEVVSPYGDTSIEYY